MYNISVIIPAFKASKTIEATINSIVKQTYQPFEIIVILDGHDDECTKIFENADFPSNVRLENLPENSGVAVARNEGIKRSNGEFIALCDADDIWHPKKLEIQISYVKKGFQLIGTQAQRFKNTKDLTFEKIEKNICNNYQNVDAQDLLTYNPFYTSSLLFSRELSQDVQFNITSKQEDYQFLIDIFNTHKFLTAIDKRDLIGYRIAENSRSGNIFYSAKNNFFIRMKNFGATVAILRLPLYFIYVIKKRYL